MSTLRATNAVDAFVADFAAQHHGVIPHTVARQNGATARQIEWRIATGRWTHLFEGVSAVAGAPKDFRRDLQAACFAAGPLAFGSHRSAAYVHGLPGGRADIVEITSRRWRRARHEGVVVHEYKMDDRRDLRVVDNLPVASPELTLLQLGATTSPLVVEMALDRALFKELVTLESAREFVERVGARGRNGAGVLRTILDERSSGDRTPESPKETQLLRLLLANGLPKPKAQYEVRHVARFVARVDFAYPDERIAIEYDSYEFHTGKLAQDRGALRRRALIAAEWRVIPVTNADLKAGCIAVAADIAAELHRR